MKRLLCLCCLLAATGTAWSAEPDDDKQAIRQAWVNSQVASFGDVETYKRCVEGSGLSWDVQLAWVDLWRAGGRLSDTISIYMEKKPPDRPGRVEQARKAIEEAAVADIQLRGDWGTLIIGRVTYQVHKTEGVWRIVWISRPEDAEFLRKQREELRQHQASTRAIDEVADAIIAGKITDPTQAILLKKTLVKKYLKLSTTQPATQEGRRP